MGGVAFERRRVVLAGAGVEEARDDDVDEHREGDHGDPDAERLDLGGRRTSRRDGLEADHPGADEDQHRLGAGGDVLGLLVAVGVVGVGRLVGLADETKAMMEAIRSIAEWIASVRIAIDPVTIAGRRP